MIFIIIGAAFVILSKSCNGFDCFATYRGRIQVQGNYTNHRLHERFCKKVRLTSKLSPAKAINGSPQLGVDGPYFVLYNFFKASNVYGVNESVTYTTHITTEFIKNVEEIANEWNGPISIAVFAPSVDYCSVVSQIVRLRACGSESVYEKVSWHLYWPKEHPPILNWKILPEENNVSCETKESPQSSHHLEQGIGYPINVGRNVARQSASTWYVFACDIELHPSRNMSQQFISFIKEAASRKHSKLLQFWPQVYVTPVFEVKQTVPRTKEDLIQQINKGNAVYFHKHICPRCHKIPGLNLWLRNLGRKGHINVSAFVSNRIPIFVKV